MVKEIKGSLLVFASAVLGLFCLGTNPISQSMRCVDEMVFLYVGDAMRRGMLPYRDVFDHKGPLLFFLNEIGLVISNGATWGVWIVEGFLFLLGGFMLIHLARRMGVGKCAATAFLLYTILIFISICGGNICETYALFFIICSLVSGFAPIVTGFSLACLIMMKFTLAVPLVIAFLFVNFQWRRIVLCLVSCGIGLLPFIVWMAVNDILGDFWDVYIIFNKSYGTASRSFGMFIARVLPAVMVALWVCSLKVRDIWLVSDTDSVNISFKRRLWIGSIVYVIAFYAMLGVMGVREEYYFIPVLPGCFLSLAYASNKFYERKLCQFRIFEMVCLLFLAFLVFRANVYVTPYIKSIIGGVPVSEVIRNIRKAGFDETLIFKDKIDNRDSVTVLGNICAIYRVLDIRTPWRYPYQRPISHFDRRIYDDVCRGIKDRTCSYLIYAKWDVEIQNLYREHWERSYFKIAETDNFVLLKAVR